MWIYFGVVEKVKIFPMKKKKKLKGYESLKEARAIAREQAHYWYASIYQESDGSYSVGTPCDKKAVFLMAIDKGGNRYVKKWVTSPAGRKYETYVRVK